MDSQCSVTARKFNAQLDGDKSKGLRFYVDEDKYRNSEDYQFQQLLQEIGTEGVITMARKIDPNWTQSELPALEHAKNVILNSLSNGGGYQSCFAPMSAPITRSGDPGMSPSASLVMDC